MVVTEEKQAPVAVTTFAVLVALSVSHLLNDTIQSLIAAVYPVLKESYALTYTQIGLITLAFQLTASLLQPLVGLYTDRRPLPFSLMVGMSVTLGGLLLLSVADTFPAILLSAALVGVGSAVFHPEASRVARLASGGWHGFAQSLFQVGGNAGSALGPLLAAFVVVPWGQGSLAWFAIAAVAAMIILFRVGRWYRAHLAERLAKKAPAAPPPVSPGKAAFAIGVLLCLIFSKYFYMASLSSYYTLYLIETFGVGVADAQLRLFVFLGAVAAGTFLGGPVGDRVGFKVVIWGSILGVLPFTLILPYANLFWTTVLTVPIGLILASAFSAIMVYAQELLPSRVGMVAGLFFGFAFGMGGVGAAVLGWLADQTSIGYVYKVCSFLPLIGLLTALLPNLRSHTR
ncbi:fosmidomycin resistance protein : Major facilitator superfamily (MFS_1) transporter OS=Blastopirellula marina DSM 3645 GN=DSM3645_17235 PE=4 SV=1: MFS_1 [Gemmata massiliana]|uniref:Major facilitator superfamily (MFS) profile domain-containing protein n=1 Tax=Gemmata massiliana TaxID=1210884 RepID=A0A6P2D8A6_9BACT|nr:fosmidomycin resistance protein : Major facilitator superfamily (MFS_1) transporter OS=Blastopirellula marina DSM 3645 GN=DSM3645_17235 PE=4 SV=1: MFS_1 [Gemmata massiliana]